MGLFGYYAVHSVINQLRKLFKTWVLIFIVICMLFGVLIGLGAAMIGDAIEDEPGSSETTPIEDPDPEPEDEIPEEMIPQIVELVAGGAVFFIFFFTAFGADKSGSSIFLPADVNILFPSPLMPQSVLMFRLMSQIGSALIGSIYLLFQIPNLMYNLGLSFWGALTPFATLFITITTAKLLQVLLYVIFSSDPKKKPFLRNGLYAISAALSMGLFLYYQSSDLEILDCLFSFFNAPVTRYIPFWGWIKYFCVSGFSGDTVGVVISIAALTIGNFLLALCIWRLKADFYEEAMAKSEETAQLLDAVNNDSGIAIVKRKKDRADRLWRDRMHYGSGANVFFFKTLYNRFRFAHFHLFTKTTETYLLTAILLSLFFHEESGLMICSLVISAFVFFRSLGNPLGEDTQSQYFVLIPESPWKKLLWSLLGGSVNCLLDILPAVVLAGIVSGAGVLNTLSWIPFILSIDFYSTTVGCFIALSVPVSAGKILKQLVQILFIYFGLLPDIGIIAVSFVLEAPVIGLILSALVNLFLGTLFFSLSPLFIEPKEGKAFREDKGTNLDLSQARKHFSKLGLSIFTILVAGSAAQIITAAIVGNFAPAFLSDSWGFWICTMAPLYLIGVPAGLALLPKQPKAEIPKRSISLGSYVRLFFISVFMMYAGNFIGNILSALLYGFGGIEVGNQIGEIATASALMPRIVFMVILAPVIEELIFRKALIDRMQPYGEKLAVITSALIFGFFHGNLAQLFYAFTLGLVFGYVYLRTGKLRYTIGLHMLVNFLGSVISVLALENVDPSILESIGTDTDPSLIIQALPSLMPLISYLLIMLLSAVIGLVLLMIQRRKIQFADADFQIPRQNALKTVLINPGMILFVLSCFVLIVFSLFA